MNKDRIKEIELQIKSNTNRINTINRTFEAINKKIPWHFKATVTSIGTIVALGLCTGLSYVADGVALFFGDFAACSLIAAECIGLYLYEKGEAIEDIYGYENKNHYKLDKIMKRALEEENKRLNLELKNTIVNEPVEEIKETKTEVIEETPVVEETFNCEYIPKMDYTPSNQLPKSLRRSKRTKGQRN